DVLYSPPPSQALKARAVRIRPSPGSRRSMTSPSETWSKAQEAAGFMVSDIDGFPWAGLPGGLGGCGEQPGAARDRRPVARFQGGRWDAGAARGGREGGGPRSEG